MRLHYLCLFLALATLALTDNKLRVHLVPFSHTDPGWLKTFEDYYSTEVARIVDSVLACLKENPERHFIWSDISFFARWFEAQNPPKQAEARLLVEKGQLAFVQGSWVSHDEASPTVESIALQIQVGQEWLRNVFGYTKPIRVGWQIDPFGHSSSSLAMSAFAGFEMVVINRIHFKAKNLLRDSGQLEFLWQGAKGAGESGRAIAHLLYKHYSAPKGFDFEDVHYTIGRHNVNMKADQLLSELRTQSKAYPTRNLLVPVGDDFKFKNAKRQYENWEMLMENINSRYSDVEIKWSTPDKYLDDLLESKPNLPIFSGDFFPYADNSDSYWTGYYSTSPTLKKKIRDAEKMLRNAEVLAVLAMQKSPISSNYLPEYLSLMDEPRKTVALVQHHDAITGTSRHATLADYHKRLDKSLESLDSSIVESLSIVAGQQVSSTAKLSNLPLYVYISNPDQSRLSTINLRLSLSDDLISCFKIFSDDDRELAFSIRPSVTDPSYGSPNELLSKMIDVVVEVNLIPFSVQRIRIVTCRSESFDNSGTTTVVINGELSTDLQSVSDLPEPWDEILLPFSTFISEDSIVQKSLSSFKGVTISSKSCNLELDDRGMLRKFTCGQRNYDLQSNFYQYRSHKSGAYLFRPDTEGILMNLRPNSILISETTLVSSVTIWYQDGTSLRWTIGNHVEGFKGINVEFTTKAEENREVVFKITGSYLGQDNSDPSFWTDNGLQLVLREKTSSMLAATFYPSVSSSALTSKHGSLSIIQTQAYGVRSEGSSIELMVARNLKSDDGRGISQGHADNSISRHEVYVLPQLDSEHVFNSEIATLINYKPICKFSHKKESFSSVSALASSSNQVRVLSLSPRFTSIVENVDLNQVVLRLLPSDYNPNENEKDCYSNGNISCENLEVVPVMISSILDSPIKMIEEVSSSLGPVRKFSLKPSGILKIPTSLSLSKEATHSLSTSPITKNSKKSVTPPDYFKPQEVKTFVYTLGVPEAEKDNDMDEEREEKEVKNDDVIVPTEEKSEQVKQDFSKSYPVVVTLHPSYHRTVLSEPAYNSNIQIFLGGLLSLTAMGLLLGLFFQRKDKMYTPQKLTV
ncbi:hypothetical protein RCL1_002133 [Eukaryota sp. TZLM3-RCL]